MRSASVNSPRSQIKIHGVLTTRAHPLRAQRQCKSQPSGSISRLRGSLGYEMKRDGAVTPSCRTSGMVWVWDRALLTTESQPICITDCCHFIRSEDSLFL